MERHKLFIRGVLTLGLFLVLDASAVAQKAPELDHLIRFTSTITTVQEKHIYEVLRGMDPDMGVWVDLSDQQVKVRSHMQLHRDELQAAWSPVGLVISYFGPILGQHLEERSADQRATIPGFEDGQPDPPGYQENKAAWILAHPKEYEQLSDPLAPH